MDRGKSAGYSRFFPWFAHLPRNFPENFGAFADYAAPFPGRLSHEVIQMDQKRHAQRICEDLRLDPEARLCPAYNSVSIKKYHLPSDEMGVRVVDNCAEENMR